MKLVDMVIPFFRGLYGCLDWNPCPLFCHPQSTQDPDEPVLGTSHEGEKQFAHILLAMSVYGCEAVSIATEMMLEAGTASEAAILNAVSRLIEEAKPQEIVIPQRLVLDCEPSADCQQYDLIRRKCHAS